MASLQRITGGLLILEGLLLLVPTAVLGSAINWPASLDFPASQMLPLLQQNLVPAQVGYSVYLLYSLLFFPVALWLVRWSVGQDNLNPVLQLALGFAALSALARSIGIVRWLVPFPWLAQQYTDPSASQSTQPTIELVFAALNSYGGTVGELLGVSLFAAGFVLLFSLYVQGQSNWPAWLKALGWLAGLALLLPWLEVFGASLGPVIVVSTSLLQIWLLAVGLWLLFWAKPVVSLAKPGGVL